MRQPSRLQRELVSDRSILSTWAVMSIYWIIIFPLQLFALYVLVSSVYLILAGKFDPDSISGGIFCLAFAIMFISALYLFGSKSHRVYLRRLCAERQGYSICTFARSFAWRQVDTWIIRAVYEETAWYLSDGRYSAPVLPTDRFDEDIRMDPDDLEDNYIRDVASRCRRDIKHMDQFPRYGEVRTVGDLVLFLNQLPKTTAI